MTTAINIIDNTDKVFYRYYSKLSNILHRYKTKLSHTYFTKNDYVQNYIKQLDTATKYEYNNIDEAGFLNRGIEFDFSKIPANLKLELIDYMQLYGYYYISDDYFTGFTISSYDNIYIQYNNKSIYADFMTREEAKDYDKIQNDLHLFLLLEQLMDTHGIYPDIIELDYYGCYYDDYKIPPEYEFLKLGMEAKENKKRDIINSLLDILSDTDDYTRDIFDNDILEYFTPEFIKKIHDNLSVEFYQIELDNNFNLSITYEISTELKLEALAKRDDIYSCKHTSHGTTLIAVETNIKQWLQEAVKENK